MSGHFIGFIFLLATVTGCSQFTTERSYISAMEQEDSQFFNPSNDFPIVVGDNGKNWNSESELQERTPKSEEDLRESQFNRILSQELKSLEASQSETALNLYEKHRHQLTTTSEKIYFLKLPFGERYDYLMSRGFVAAPKIDSFSQADRKLAASEHDILMGMSKDDVIDSWGKPTRVEIAGNPRNQNERWLYKLNGAAKYIYFESGQVQGWE